MYSQVDKPKEDTSKVTANSGVRKRNTEREGFGFMNNRPKSIMQMKMLQIGKTFNNAPGDRDNGKLGLGEVLTLTSQATGADREGEGKGTAEYKKESGTGTLIGDSYTSDETGGSVQFSVKRADESDDFKDELSIEVVTPNGAKFVSYQDNNTIFEDDEAGAAFLGENSEYFPDSVSFIGLEFREGEAPLAATGVYAPHNGVKHENGVPITVNEKNIENSNDTINTPATSEDEFEKGGPGTAKWPIPWEYSLKGKNDWKAFMTADHDNLIDDNAKVTVTKLNGTTTRAPAKGTWKYKPQDTTEKLQYKPPLKKC